MQDRDLTTKELAGLESTTELMEQTWAPCRYACPVHADVRGYVELISQGRWREAIDLIRDRLPFASVCGRICHHPCETNCRRGDVDEPVAIREVKRFVSELQGAAGATVFKAASQDKAQVAIVGSGPAGMSAALELARLGYRPTVFEKFPVAGGIPATAIPRYRLPREVLQQDVDWICAHGVTVRTSVEIGRDKTIADLKADGFEAVLIAAGLADSRMLDIKGADHDRVYPAVKFLTSLAFDEPVEIGQAVLIIGGGDVAMDAARTALRMGARSVVAMCLENEEEMPALKWEQQEALEEGVSFIHRRGPVEIVVEGGAIKSVKARKVLRVFDEEKRFNPTYDDSDTIDVECDTVIMAIGQKADYGFAESGDLRFDERGRLVFNQATHQTSESGVFACGEIITPPGSVVEACASGRRAALAVDMHLSNREIVIDDALPPEIDEIPADIADKVPQVARCVVKAQPPDRRIKNFDEIDYNLSADEAMRESRRCLLCGGGAEVLVDKCVACLTCLRICPFDVPRVTDVARIESQLCQACGMCIGECPNNAIVARGWDVGDLAARTKATLAALQADKKIIAFVCGHHASQSAWSAKPGDTIDGLGEVYLPSMSRLSAAEILHVFESGAAGVLVIACEDGTDRYPKTTQRIARRVAQAQEMLAEIGVSADLLKLVNCANQGRDTLRRALAEGAEAIRAC
ncbi:MAG: FAD-dependent oxidoreductase [Planctomycetes bacterium]|nr:FAD-dependent oxidoreductase [Planctomycetota bacterium]